MDLLNDLGNDLAVAFLIEKKHRQKLDSRGAVDLIDRIRAALNSTPQGEPDFGNVTQLYFHPISASSQLRFHRCFHSIVPKTTEEG